MGSQAGAHCSQQGADMVSLTYAMISAMRFKGMSRDSGPKGRGEIDVIDALTAPE